MPETLVNGLRGAAEVHLALGDHEQAHVAIRRALAIHEKRWHDRERASLASVLVVLARVQLARGEPLPAVQTIERALPLLDAAPRLAPSAKFTMATATWQLGRDRSRARELASEALAQLRADPHRRAADDATLAEIEGWLAQHDAAAR